MAIYVMKISLSLSQLTPDRKLGVLFDVSIKKGYPLVVDDKSRNKFCS